MATVSDPRNPRVIVNYDEPERRQPPIAVVGPLAWMRENLFKTTLDSIVTVVASIALLWVIISTLQWAISAANWFVIISNFRLFMAGQFPVEYLWRVNLAALLFAFAAGFSLFAFARVTRAALVVIVVIVAALFIVPVIINIVVPPSSAYLAAGDVAIESGTVTETPTDRIAFIGQAGETVTFSLPEIPNDAALLDVAGFTARAAAAILNNAGNRLEEETQLELWQANLSGDLLTAAQREEITEEVSETVIEAPVTETFAINETGVELTLLNAQGEPIESAVLTSESPALAVELPADGWYIVQKTLTDPDAESVALIRAQNVYPLRERNLSESLESGGTRRINEYVRMNDDFTTRDQRPVIDGAEPPLMVITDYGYQGARSFSDYLDLFIAPFFNMLAMPTLQLVLFGAVGYVAASGVMRVLPSRGRQRAERRAQLQSAASWVWLIYLVALFLLLYGIQGLTGTGIGVLLSRFAWVGLMYFVGMSMNAGKAYARPLFALLLILVIIQTVIAEGLTLNAFITPWEAFVSGVIDFGTFVGRLPLASLFAVILWAGIGYYAARMGAGQKPLRDERLTRALIISGAVYIALFLLPILLLPVLVTQTALTPAAADNLLPVVNTQRWGGFLLTMLLTIVAILASFPLGVLLALGRRSSLPVVKWTCIIYIELVRGVPLITVLFMAQLLVPLVNPALAEVDNVFRAMVGLTMFSAAYLAENVRGGLQSVPHGQEEAAKALGLSGFQVTMLITLPQALRAVIPALVGQAIALFKDTSLVALVGLIDLTGMARSVIAQPEYVGLQSEVYLFISILYFIVSYIMAAISRRIEASGSGAARRV